MTLQVQSIAIIGAGPSGLAALYEFLHTSKDGVSTFGGKEPEDKAFGEIVVFEQKSNVGGVWASADEAEKIPNLRDFYEHETLHDLLESKEANVQRILDGLKVQDLFKDGGPEEPVSWKGTALYKNLFTSIPKRFTRFSSSDYNAVGDGRVIDPFLRDYELRSHIQQFVDTNNLEEYIKFDTEVIKAIKCGSKWHLILKHEEKNTAEITYYKKEVDAVVVANGTYSLPYIPHIEGLKEYEDAYPGSILHSKFFRDYNDYTNKRIIVLGSSVSGMALSQYLKPIAKEFILSRKERKEYLEWINEIVSSNELIVKPPIRRFISATREIEFEDGTKIKDFDKILLATGYYPYYPFLGKGVLSLSVPSDKKGPANSSRIRNLYYNIFKIDDPTLAFVGLVKTAQLFTAFEAQSAAIAGIWSNAKLLPPPGEQADWERKRLNEIPDTSRFYMFSNEDIKSEYIDKIKHFFPLKRKYPLDENYFDHFDDFKKGEDKLADLSFKLMRGQVVFRNGEYIEI